jgi:hypothetical protein
MIKGAHFSFDNKHRYALWRTWDESKGHVMFIGLNPSTADEKKDDPTVRRCICFAQDWGYGGIYMMNIFAYRTTYPVVLMAAYSPIGVYNDRFLVKYAKMSSMVIACWGGHGHINNRGNQVKEILPKLYHLGLTKYGQPKHPLYLKKDTIPILWKSEQPDNLPTLADQ